MTNTQNEQEMKARIKSLLGDQWTHQALASMPDLDATPNEIGKTKVFAAISDKTSYLAWIAEYRALIKNVENHIRHMKAKRFDENIWTQADAQSQRSYYAAAATAMIQARRLGKVWSADQAKKHLDAAA